MTSSPSVLARFIPDGASPAALGVVFVVLCGIVAGLLTMLGPRETLEGLLRLGVSHVTAPFVFLLKSADEVARYGREGDRELRKSDQYLLGHVYLYLLGGGVLAAILWVAGVLTFVVFSLLPPAGSGKALSEARKSVQASQAAVDAAERDLKEQKTAGPERVAAEAERTKAAATKAVREAEKSFTLIRSRMAARGGLNMDVIDGLEIQLDERARDTQDPEAVRTDFTETLSNNTRIDEADRQELTDWLNAWAVRAEARKALADAVDEPVAAQVARLVTEAEGEVASAKTKHDEARAEVTRREAARKPRWASAFYALCLGPLALAIAAWVFGLLAESWALLLRLTADVRALRGLATSTGPAAPATDAGHVGPPEALSGRAGSDAGA